jgi:hypothetical protein
MSYAEYSLYVALAGAMAAICSSSNAKAQSTIAPPKCVSAVVVQAPLGYNVRFHNNCEYTVTVYWGKRLGNGGGIIQSTVNIPSANTTDAEAYGSDIDDMKYYSCPAFHYKLTYKTRVGAIVTLYNGSDTLVCSPLG